MGVSPGRLNGVDLLEARVDAARGRLPDSDIRRADARDLPFQDGTFETILMLTCLSSMADDNAVLEALEEAGRVLSPTGLILIYEPWVANPFNRATRLISRSSLTRALGTEEASMRVTGLPPLARRLGPMTQRLYPALARIAPTHRLRAFSRPGG